MTSHPLTQKNLGNHKLFRVLKVVRRLLLGSQNYSSQSPLGLMVKMLKELWFTFLEPIRVTNRITAIFRNSHFSDFCDAIFQEQRIASPKSYYQGKVYTKNENNMQKCF